MAQILYRDGSDASATEVITVADLLSRNAPTPFREVEPDVEPDTDGISVGALLRREGRAPHGADRPLPSRPRQQAAREDEGGTDRRVLVRRGAIAAGTLLAAGSVLGAALITDVTPTANQTPAPGGAEDEGPYPGQGLLDPEGPVAAPPDSVVIDQAAARDPLDPGSAAPSDWVPVAFPGALAGGETGADEGTSTDGGGTDNGGSSGSSGDDGSSAATTSGDDDDDDSTSTSDTGSSASNGSSGGSSSSDNGGSDSDSESRDDDDGDDGDGDGLLSTVGKTVGGVVEGVGGALGLGDDDEKSKSSDDGDDDDKGSRSMSLMSADDEDEDSSAPHDEDGSESSSDAKSGDSDDSEDSDSDSGDSDDGDSDSDDGDGGLVSGLLGTVGGLVG